MFNHMKRIVSITPLFKATNRSVYLVVLGLIFLSTGCKNGLSDEAAEADFAETKTLQDGVILIDDCEPVGNMVLGDSLLWLAGSDNSELLHLYTISGKPVAAGMSIGQGGDDVLELSSIHPVDSKIYVYDSNGGVISELEYADGKVNVDRRVSDMRFYDDAIVLPDSSVMALPLNSDNAYAVFDRHNNMVDSLSYFPPKPAGISDRTHHLACTGMLAYSPADTMFARTIVYDGGIDFFSVKDGRIAHKARHANFDMAYSTLNGQGMLPVPSDESRVGYSYVYATPSRFYASYSEDKCLDNPAAMSSEIHVFDHNGKLQYKLLTDKRIQSFAVSDDDSQLYVAEVDNDDNITVKRYTL